MSCGLGDLVTRLSLDTLIHKSHPTTKSNRCCVLLDLVKQRVCAVELTTEINKCCPACFNRIARMMGTNPQTNEPLVPQVPDDNSDGELLTKLPIKPDTDSHVRIHLPIT